MRAVAKTGRYFPIRGAELARAAKTWSLRGKVPLAFRNPDDRLAKALALAKLRPGKDLVVFSLPTEIEEELGARAAFRALEVLSRWKDAPVMPVSDRSRTLVVYFEAPAQLRVVEHRTKYSRGKFGAGEGLATSRKPRVTSEVSTQLAVVEI